MHVFEFIVKDRIHGYANTKAALWHSQEFI